MSDASAKNARFGDSGVIELTGKIMVVAIFLLFFVIIFVFCLHLYAKWFWYRRDDDTATTTRRRRRLDFSAGHQEVTIVSGARRGLDPSVLKTIPIIAFNPKMSKEGLECAVCLCEVSEGEKTRLLPKCNHGFHVECIDMWFQSHSTCPLCRNPVDNQNQSNCVNESALESSSSSPVGENSSVVTTEAANFPTNVLIWGDETQVSSHQGNAVAETSSSSSGVSMIEDDDEKSAVPTRLRSLKRLLSGNRRVNPSSPRNLDIEQGSRGQS